MLNKFCLSTGLLLFLTGLLLLAYMGPQADVATPAQGAAASASEETGEKLVAFTFDDGPGPYTGELLDELAARDAKATFFVIGKRVSETSAPLLKRMVAEGHVVGSHTYGHVRLAELNNAQIAQELEKADEAIAGAVGSPPALLRPPYGNNSKRVQDIAGKPVILWSLDTDDWEIKDAAKITACILKQAQDGDIILLHELDRTSIQGAMDAMDVLMDEGYRFVTVPELFRLRGIELVAGEHYHHAHPDLPPQVQPYREPCGEGGSTDEAK